MESQLKQIVRRAQGALRTRKWYDGLTPEQRTAMLNAARVRYQLYKLNKQKGNTDGTKH